VTGSRGFLGKNLVVRLNELNYQVYEFTRGDSIELLPNIIANSDVVVHLAGENRPPNALDYSKVNFGLTKEICNAINLSGKKIPIVFSSSSQADDDNFYGKSKLEAENFLERWSIETGNPVSIYRLPGVFGKWCKPNYNSVVATFCNNIAKGLPIEISNPDFSVRLVYVDDVINKIILSIEDKNFGIKRAEVDPEYLISLGDLAKQIALFKESRKTLISESVGCGLVRALYSTYISYLPVENFSYELLVYGDDRGEFVEMLKTKDSGQFSYFTAHPGVTRGGHYHHTKSEKFLVIRGQALFRFRNVISGERYEIAVEGGIPRVVETIPGWTHDITNIGKDELVVMLWANEIFDRSNPDTIADKV